MKLLAILFCSMLAANAQDLAWASLALIDLGTIIKSAPLVGDTSLLRAYALSGMQDEETRSVIVLQGLNNSGLTDINIDTYSGLVHLPISLTETNTEDQIMNTAKSRSCIIKQFYPVELERSLVIEVDAPLNEFVLAAQPTLVELRHLHQDNDPMYLRTIVLQAKAAGTTDIVIATKSRVYKLTIKIGGTQNEHTERIKLDANSCLR